MTNLPPIIMTEQEILDAEEQSLELLCDHLEKLERQQKEKHKRPHSPIEPRMLRTKEAAAYIGVSEWQLRQMVIAGEIEVVKRKYFLFSVADLDKWIARNREREVL